MLASSLEYSVEGVRGELKENVISWLGAEPATPEERSNFIASAAERVSLSLKAIGYYEPEIAVEIDRSTSPWQMLVRIESKEPVRITAVDVRLEGDASADSAFNDVRASAPLLVDDVLHHGIYEELKKKILNLGQQRGYFDGVISQSDAQAADLWRYRELISESTSSRTPYKNDLSVRVSRLPGYLQQLQALIADRYPDFEVLLYGHIGDGNLHLNILRPEEMSLQAFENACRSVNDAVFSLTRSAGGSISAEHGIGLLKQPYLEYTRSAVEIEHMRGIKRQLDPAGILNPGKLLPG